jgi:hypothetical protein
VSRLLSAIRAQLGITTGEAHARRELAASGWDEVLTQASCFYWRIWLGPPRIRRAWYRDIKLHGMPEGSLRELLEHVFRPIAWNRRLAILNFPRRSRGGRGLITRHPSGLQVIG